MKTFKHRTNGQIATYKNGVFKQGNCCVDLGVEPSSAIWEESIWTTEDGIAVFEKENVAWVICGRYKYMLSLNPLHIKTCLTNTEIYKVFSTKEKALEYELLNKKALFTTEDGVEIFEGDKVFCLHRHEGGKLSGFISETSTSPYPFDSSVPVFTKKENAEKFIKENSKVFSLQDIKDIMVQPGYFSTTLIDLLAKKL